MAITRTAWTDDDGTGTTGTIINNAGKTELYDQIDAAIAAGGAVVQTTTLTGTQNNFALTALAGFLRCNNATLLTLTGLAAGVDGQMLDIVSVGAGQVDIPNQSGSSTAANRFLNGTTGTLSLSAGLGTMRLTYDATTACWRVLEHEQGAWITPAFAAGNYTASGSMTWTLAAGDVNRFKYHQKGRALRVSIYLTTTTVGGTPSNVLKILVPNGLSIQGTNDLPIRYSDNGTAGIGFAEGNSTFIDCYKADLSNWAASTDATIITINATFEVG